MVVVGMDVIHERVGEVPANNDQSVRYEWLRRQTIHIVLPSWLNPSPFESYTIQSAMWVAIRTILRTVNGPGSTISHLPCDGSYL